MTTDSSRGSRPSFRSVQPGLTLAEHLAGAADRQVALGELEAVAAVAHRLEPRRALVRRRVGEQVAPRPVRAATDPAAELVQLEQPEAVGVLDDHHRRVRDVDADLDDRGRDQHVERAGAELRHHPFLVGGRHLPVQQPEAQPREILLLEALRTPRSPPSPRASAIPRRAGRPRTPGGRRRPRRAPGRRPTTRSSGLGPTTSVVIGERPAGRLRSSDRSRSP